MFSGLKGGYIESDYKHGSGFYAQTKALGELNDTKDLTIRISIIGPELNSSGIGLLHWFLKQDNDIYGYTNAYWSGVTTLELAKFINFLLQSKVDLKGLFHLTNNIKIDKFSLLNIFQSTFKNFDFKIIPNPKYKIDKSFVNTSTDIKYNVPSYQIMTKELHNFILAHKSLYSYRIND